MNNHEHQEQVALFQWAAYNTGKYPDLKLLYAIPNAFKRTPRQGKWMKDEGMKKGVPDLCLPVARLGYHGLYIEMKKSKQYGRSYPSKEQKEWIVSLKENGYYVDVCYGFDEAQETIIRYLSK